MRARASRGSRWSASVATSAARMSLSGRSARISGWERARSTAAAVPTRMPACGPPISLSALKATRSQPAATLAAASGSPATAASGRRTPLPRSSTSARPAPREARELLDRASANPTTRKFEVHAQDRPGARPIARS